MDEADAVPDAEVRAAAERWAQAAGVPVAVAVPPPPRRAPAAARFVRGLVLGSAFGSLLLATSADWPSAALWGLLALAVGVLAGRIVQ